MNNRLAWFGMMWLAVACCRCTSDDAYAATRPALKVDAGMPRAARAVVDAGSRPSAGAGASDSPSSAAASPDSILGLTRAQLLARRGQPTEKRGVEWVYTPDQPGCREMITSEVVTFKRNVVASVRLDRARTNKVCRGPGRSAPRP